MEGNTFMLNFGQLLASNVAIPDWIAKSVPIVRSVIIVLIVLFCLAITICVLATPSDPDGGNAITGYNESFYAQNKGLTREGRLKRVIIISSICVFVLAILYYATFLAFAGEQI